MKPFHFIHWQDNRYRIYRKQEGRDTVAIFIAEVAGRENAEKIVKMLNA